MKIYSIFDAKAEAFMNPFFVQAEGVAIREFTNLANDPEHPVGKYREDYTLYRLGTWDERTGKIVTEEPFSVISARSVGVE